MVSLLFTTRLKSRPVNDFKVNLLRLVFLIYQYWSVEFIIISVICMVASTPIHAFLEYLLPAFHILFSKAFFLQVVLHRIVCNIIQSSPHSPDFWQPVRKRLSENIVGKGENAGNQHFRFVPKCFLSFLTLSQTSPGFYVSAVQAFWKQCGKRRNCS